MNAGLNSLMVLSLVAYGGDDELEAEDLDADDGEDNEDF